MTRERVRVSKTFTDKILTKQNLASQCDVNKIIAHHAKTGQITHLNQKNPQYADVSNYQSHDYQSALNLVMDAEDRFNGLNSKIREKFQNNPFEMLAFIENPANLEEAVKLGIVEKALPNDSSASGGKTAETPTPSK